MSQRTVSGRVADYWGRTGRHLAGELDLERGLSRLAALLREEAPNLLTEFYTQEVRLRSNLRDERAYGTTETLRAERSRVVEVLNDLTLRAGLEVSYNDLCRVTAADRIDDLEQRILENYRYIREYEKGLALVDQPEEQRRSRWLTGRYWELIRAYFKIYLPLCGRTGHQPGSELVEIARDPQVGIDVEQWLRDQTLPDSFEIYTGLPGSRIVRVAVSQMFRMADLLTSPESVRAKELYQAFTNPDKLRRTLNRRRTFSIGTLGDLRPVITIMEEYDQFWKPARPNLRLPTCGPICFVPFELSLSPHLQRLDCLAESVLESASLRTLEGIQNTQVGGRLRIYPPGIGVIQLGITIEFRESIHVEVVAQMAHDIETLYFVDPQGLRQPCADILLDIVRQVSEEMFDKEAIPFDERSWQPPVTAFSFRDDDGLSPEERIDELAYLMDLAPGNQEERSDLRDRIEQALRSSHWQNDKVLAVAGQGVALYFVAQAFAYGKAGKRKRLLEWLAETHELVMAGAYAQQAFAEKIEEIAGPKRLDDSWLPANKANFTYLVNLLSTMHQVMGAITRIKRHLQQLGAYVLLSFGKDVWAYGSPVDVDLLQQGLDYIAEWSTSQATGATKKAAAELKKVAQMAATIGSIHLPFSTRQEVTFPEVQLPEEAIEARILEHLRHIEYILQEREFEGWREIDQRLRSARQLGKCLE